MKNKSLNSTFECRCRTFEVFNELLEEREEQQAIFPFSFLPSAQLN